MNLKFIAPFFKSCFIPALFILSGTALYGQKPSKADVSKPDTIKLSSTTTVTDSSSKKSPSSGLASRVSYTAEDSIITDLKNNVVYLYGKGRVVYEDFELDADYVRLDQKKNSIFASGIKDAKNGRFRGKPIFKQGSEPPLTTDSLVFNYKTGKGKSYAVFSEVEGGYLQAGQFKKNEFNEGFIKGGFYSTCNLPEPHTHFGIHITKGIVTEKQIITGPAYLVIEHVPLPLAVPFGFFPKPNKRVSGFRLPTPVDDAARGFGLQNFGYYLGLSDYWDLMLGGSFYSKGSYDANSSARYTKNYKYSGNIDLSYASTRRGVEGTPEYKPSKDFNIRWNHSQNPLANPGTTFSASVNAGTSQYNQNSAASGTYNIREITRNTVSSSISYGKVFANGLFNFTSSLSHSQNFADTTVSLSLPEFSLGMTSALNPFDSKKRVGEPKWYQKINVGPYTLQGSNSISTKEYLLFKKDALGMFRNGFQHNLPVNLSMNVFRYFQFNTSIPYSEKWYLQTVRKSYGPVASGFANIIDTVPGFSRAYEYSLSSGLSTKIYGQKNFRKGKLIAIRHVMSPSVSFNYKPDFSDDRFGFFKNSTEVVPGSRPAGISERYSIFENGIYGSPSQGKQAGISFFVDNNVEAKVRSTKDSVNNFIKIPILQGLSFQGSYNFAAEKFRLSPITFSGRTALFSQKLGVNFTGTFDPYEYDAVGGRLNEFAIRSGTIANLTNFGLSMDFSLNSAAVNRRTQRIAQAGQTSQNMTPQQAEELRLINSDPNAFVDFNIPWNISASYSLNYTKYGQVSVLTNTSKSSVTNTLNFSGDLSVTPKWKVQYTSGYDFSLNQLSITQFSIYRDLHCWDLSLTWIPIGPYRSYSVNLRVKASVLQDLKLSRNRTYYNNF